MYKLITKSIKSKIKVIQHDIRLFFSSYQQDFVIVTGADSSHFKSLCQLLSSLLKHESTSTIVVYDLGLLDSQRALLKQNFAMMELRRFNYADYPDYLNIKINAGEYAWKPVILNQVLNEFKCCVCWLDAGNLVTKPLIKLRKSTELLGLYSPWSQGTISDWTHPKTIKYLAASNDILGNRNLNGACISVNFKHLTARKLIMHWRECALIKECIAPEGSGRHNHRQDQAVLSVLAHKLGIGQNMVGKRLDFKIHQDID